MKMVKLYSEVEIISRPAQSVLLGGDTTSGGSTGSSSEEEDPPWIYPNSGTQGAYNPIDYSG
ncbi:hypothetical protein AB9P05_11620 [Roseivirga sp. BDSF3-8]|uniref:hypothetical protein n=1 Tax=Roseivirga sp. BDSF3-8 TaxID=3241598 RepID=UPI0035324E9A